MSLMNLRKFNLSQLVLIFRIDLLQQLLSVLIFSGLLSISFLDGRLFYFAWFAFVPLLFAIERASYIKVYWLGIFGGVTAFVSGMYWIADFINIARASNETSNLWLAIFYWLYCAHMIAFILLLFNWFRKSTRIHDFLLFPVVVATFTSAFPMLFPMRLGESQYNFYSALQATEYLGVYALDAIIALCNIVIFHLLQLLFSNSKERIIQSKWPWTIAISLITLWFTYGVISYSNWDKEIASWDRLKVGLVQPNETPTLGRKIIYPGYSQSYPPEMEMTERLVSLGTEIIIWPEAYPKGYLNNEKIRAAYQLNLNKLGSSLLFQDLRNMTNPKNGQILFRYNSAIMLNNEGQQVGLYNKMKRIPFGEYIPILNDGSGLNNWLELFLGKFLNKYSKGENHQLFKHERINIVPLICYETTFPDFVGGAVGQTARQAEKSNGTMLVALSNDGWFGSTHQPYQHIMASVLRAVENRLPLVHVANNGPSIVVSPHGKVIFQTGFQRAGGFIADVPHSSTAKGSFYSRNPSLFTNILYGMLILISLYGLFRNKKKVSRTGKEDTS